MADNLSVRASTTGPKTVARSFALLRLDTLARTLFAIILIRDGQKKIKEIKKIEDQYLENINKSRNYQR